MHKEIDHKRIPNYLVCPYCGHRQYDIDFRLGSMEGEIECPKCDRAYEYEGQLDPVVYWTTKKMID